MSVEDVDEQWQALEVLLDDVIHELLEEPEPEPQQPDNLDIAAVLDGAAEWLRDNGWTQHRPFRFDPETGSQYACANAAIYRAAGFAPTGELLFGGEVQVPGGADWKIQVWHSACNALSDHVGQESWRWNDALGQTKRRVIQTLEELAQQLRTAA